MDTQDCLHFDWIHLITNQYGVVWQCQGCGVLKRRHGNLHPGENMVRGYVNNPYTDLSIVVDSQGRRVR